MSRSDAALRPAAFVLAASDHGTMIVNRYDYCSPAPGQFFGVGFQVLEHGYYDKPEVEQLLQLLSRRRAHFGDGVVAVDCGANIGIHTVEWAKRMTGWGRVIAVEAQERIFYALAGNLAVNNCFNARAVHAAVSDRDGVLRMPVPDYRTPGSFGSLELRASQGAEFIGQELDYSEGGTAEVRTISLDGLGLQRLDLLKIDVEGMEGEALDGARAAIDAFRPIIVAEHVKVGWDALAGRLSPLGYALYRTPMNLVAVHPSDPTAREIRVAA